MTQKELTHEAICETLKRGPDEAGRSAEDVVKMSAAAACGWSRGRNR